MPEWTKKEGWARGADAEREVQRPEREEFIKSFRLLLDAMQAVGEPIRETIELTPEGLVTIEDTKKEGTLPSPLCAYAIPTGLIRSGREAHKAFTYEDLLLAADELSQKFQGEVDFQITPDSSRRKFEYSAAWKKPEK